MKEINTVIHKINDNYQRETVVVTAWISRNCPGLAVNKAPHDDKLYNVTHLQSGYAVATEITSKYKAFQIMRILCETGVDWTKSAKQIINTKHKDLVDKKIPQIERINGKKQHAIGR
jgi:DUF1680 family protein